MKEGQDKIYYVTAENFAAAQEQPAPRNLPQEGRRSAAADRSRRRMDAVGILHEFDGKQLVSVAKGDLDLGKLEDEAEKKRAQEKEASEYKELVEKMKTALGDKVKDVRVTLA